jgi:pimeloyl-ACP methyl ester carboxylesterase
MLVDIPARVEGSVMRDGLRIAYQVFGDGPQAILLLPTWSIVHSDHWRLQVPHLARRYTVVAFDGRGNGTSDRPSDPALYAEAAFADDAVAVLDAAGVERAAILSVSQGSSWGAILAATRPARVAAAVFIGPSLPLAPNSPERVAAAATFDEPRDRYEGWGKWNRHYWAQDWRGFLEFFMAQCFTEPDSESHIRHFVNMGLETTPEIVTATIDAPGLDAAAARTISSAIACPVLVIHGDADAIAPLAKGAELARLTHGDLHVLPGAGHEPELREADQTNKLIDDFLAATHRAAT